MRGSSKAVALAWVVAIAGAVAGARAQPQQGAPKVPEPAGSTLQSATPGRPVAPSEGRATDGTTGPTPGEAASAAASGSASAPARAPEPPAELAPSTGRRVLPDYDGRKGPPTTVADGFLWVPRVVFFPAYVVVEYVFRRPIGWLVSKAEREHWPQVLTEYFTFGPEHNSGVVPTAFFDFGLKPSVGLYLWFDKFLTPRNALRVQLGTWGLSWLQVTGNDRLQVGEFSYVGVYGTFLRRPDNPFFGLGSRSLYSNITRYKSDLIEGGFTWEAGFSRQNKLVSSLGVRHRNFGEGDCCGDPGLVAGVRAGRFNGELPPGFDGYTAAIQRLELVLDSRPRRPANQDGVRMDLEVERGSELRSVNHGANWVRYGGTVGGYLDVGKTRTFGLKMTALFVDPLQLGPSPRPIPFTEQIILGGTGPMRGFFFNRLIGRSAAVAELEYRWPVWVFVDGAAHVAVGNVFGEHLRGMSLDQARLSAAMGVKSNNSADHQFELLVGFGTETWAQGLEVTSFRLVFGGTRGF